MKTQLQYPNGLSITIEHDEQFAPHISEKPGFSYDDVVERNRELIKERADLQKRLSEFEADNVKLQLENSDLRNKLSKIHVRPVTDMKLSKKKVKPAPEKKEKPATKWSKKTCAKCGQLFQPTGPRSTLCENCKAEKQIEPAE